MKQVFSIMLLLIVANMNAQTVRKTISTKKINGYLECEKILKIENGDSLVYIVCSYPNGAYQTIKDTGRIIFFSQEKVESFKAKLNEAAGFVGQKSEVELTGDGFRLVVPEKGKTITFYDAENKFMGINQAMIDKWIQWLNENPLPK